ncbi:hypothetical protein QUB37_03830 [Microcoleus sp. AT3-A2]|uniref:hypothetical protein n=1 Tax=Microcoleus sp. AT3-A2 TaxID=2818610 RepID=UPI002FD0D974
MTEILLAKAQYWVERAEKHDRRGEHCRMWCDYITAASYFFELRDQQQLRKIFKKCPEVERAVSAKIVEFANSGITEFRDL